LSSLELPVIPATTTPLLNLNVMGSGCVSPVSPVDGTVDSIPSSVSRPETVSPPIPDVGTEEVENGNAGTPLDTNNVAEDGIEEVRRFGRF
jgi:hypothetical protein